MGARCSCEDTDYLQGEAEVVYEDTVLRLERRPQNYRELVSTVLQFVPAAKSEQDLVLEYVAAEEVGRILSDLSLFEAYILSHSDRPVIGVKLCRYYIPVRGDGPTPAASPTSYPNSPSQ